MTTAVDSTTTPELASRLRHVVAHLSRRMRQNTLPGDLTFTKVATLATVEREGPLTLGELAAAERVQPPTMTKIVAHLEEMGYLTRTPDPNDRRVARAEITAAGRRYLEKNRRQRSAFLAKRLRTLSADDVAALERALPVLERLAREEAP